MLFMQDPDDSETVYLLEELLEASDRAQRGGGVFAFATAAGSRLLLEDETFTRFASVHPFDLVIGIDGITDEKALATIINAARILPQMNVFVFLHDRQDALFHPKFCWFRGPGGGKLIVGSGNLTMGGLRDNWEAFTSISITKAEAIRVEASWLRWMKAHSTQLLPPNDARVIERASKNTASVRLARSEVRAVRRRGRTWMSRQRAPSVRRILFLSPRSPRAAIGGTKQISTSTTMSASLAQSGERSAESYYSTSARMARLGS